MAVVKISELPAMVDGAVAGGDLLPIVDTSETETKKITKQQLLTDINASEVQIGQLTEATQINDEDYLIITQNGTNKKISKANAKFASGDEIAVSTTQPTGEDAESVVLWINPNEDSVDVYGGYKHSENEQLSGEYWVNGEPIYIRTLEYTIDNTTTINACDLKIPDATTKIIKPIQATLNGNHISWYDLSYSNPHIDVLNSKKTFNFKATNDMLGDWIIIVEYIYTN